MSPERPMPWISLRRADGHPANPAVATEARPRPRPWEPVVSASHQAGGHPTFSLSHPAVTQEVVAVHHGQLAQEELDGALAPSLLWTLALGEDQDTRQVSVSFGGGRQDTGTLLPAPASV